MAHHTGLSSNSPPCSCRFFMDLPMKTQHLNLPPWSWWGWGEWFACPFHYHYPEEKNQTTILWKLSTQAILSQIRLPRGEGMLITAEEFVIQTNLGSFFFFLMCQIWVFMNLWQYSEAAAKKVLKWTSGTSQPTVLCTIYMPKAISYVWYGWSWGLA